MHDYFEIGNNCELSLVQWQRMKGLWCISGSICDTCSSSSQDHQYCVRSPSDCLPQCVQRHWWQGQATVLCTRDLTQLLPSSRRRLAGTPLGSVGTRNSVPLPVHMLEASSSCSLFRVRAGARALWGRGCVVQRRRHGCCVHCLQ